MSKAALAVVGLSDFKVTIPDEYRALINSSVASAKAVTVVGNPEQQETAIARVSALKGITTQLEKDRVAFTAPYLNAQREIKSVADKTKAEAQTEIDRIENLLGRYQAEERRKADEARRKQEDEQRKRDTEARVEQYRLERLAHDQQQAEERAAQAQRDLEAAKGRKAQQEALRAKQEADAAALKAQQDREAADFEAGFTEQAPEPAPIEEAPKATGAAVRTSLDFEVTDIVALYNSFPQAVELGVRRGFLKDYINQPGVDLSKIKGITTTEKTKVAVRAAAPGLLQ